MADLKALFQYYLDHQVEFVREYNGKYLVIKDNAIAGVYDSQEEAYYEAEHKYGLGNFIIQLCTEGDDAYTQHYTSRVVF